MNFEFFHLFSSLFSLSLSLPRCLEHISMYRSRKKNRILDHQIVLSFLFFQLPENILGKAPLLLLLCLIRRVFLLELVFFFWKKKKDILSEKKEEERKKEERKKEERKKEERITFWKQGGSGAAIWVDSELLNGTSSVCQTFGNQVCFFFCELLFCFVFL